MQRVQGAQEAKRVGGAGDRQAWGVPCCREQGGRQAWRHFPELRRLMSSDAAALGFTWFFLFGGRKSETLLSTL